MNKQKIIVSVVVLLVLKNIAASPVRNTRYDFSKVDSYLKTQAKLKKSRWNGYPEGKIYPNGLALLVMQDGKVLYDNGYEGMTSSSVIPFASGSKWLAGITVIKAIDEGYLTLDTKTSDILPYFKGKKGTATIRELFTHTAGYPSDHPLCLDFDITLEECVKGLAKVNLVSSPGQKIRYSSVSMQIGARMVEVTTGEDWQTYFDKHIATPLNMPNTDWEAHLATQNPRIAGAVRTCGKDYAQYLQMIIDHGYHNQNRFISRDTLELMLRDQTRDAEIESIWQNYRYGIGCFMETMDEDKNGIVISHPGSIGVAPWIDRSRGLVCVLSASCGFNDSVGVYRELQKLVAEAVDNQNPKRFRVRN